MSSTTDKNDELKRRIIFKLRHHHMPPNIYEGGGEPNIEHCANQIMQLIEQAQSDYLERVIPEKHVCDKSCDIDDNEWSIGHRAYIDAESNTIDQIRQNARKEAGE